MSIELAWAAGFFDGEGSIFGRRIARAKGGTTGKYYPVSTVEMTLSQVRREPLDRFVAAVGIGRVAGPYIPKAATHSPYYKWSVEGRPSVRNALLKLWPYMSLPKKEQALKAWKWLEDNRSVKSPILIPLPPLSEEVI